MQVVKLARRYAKAIAEVAREAHLETEFEKCFAQLSQLLGDKRGSFYELFFNPAFLPKERSDVVKSWCDLQKSSPLVVRTLLLLVEKNRFCFVPDIYKAFLVEMDAHLGRVRASVSSARALTDKELQPVEAALSKRMGKSVILTASVDPLLLGGLKAQIGSTLMDATLDTQLRLLENSLDRAAMV